MQVEVPNDAQGFLEQLQQYESIENELLLKQLFNYGLESMRREYAVKLFAEGKVSIGEGAMLANLSVGEYLELLTARGVKSKVQLADYQEGLDNARKMFSAP